MATDWSKVQRSHIVQACDEYDSGKSRPKRGAVRIRLYFNDREYPAKHIQGHSYFLATKEPLDPNVDYSSSNRQTTRFFENLGFWTTESELPTDQPHSSRMGSGVGHAGSEEVQLEYLKPNQGAEAEFKIVEGDFRESLFCQIKIRRGQQAFRNGLLERYGKTCMVSGCNLMDIIEAAHIKPYRGVSDNHPENGILLRTDLHTLFDLDYIGIEPGSLLVHVHPSVRDAGYSEFDGLRLKCKSTFPSEEALAMRWQRFQRRA